MGEEGHGVYERGLKSISKGWLEIEDGASEWGGERRFIMGDDRVEQEAGGSSE